MDALIKIMSKQRINPTQFIISARDLPSRICPVNWTDPMAIGTMSGYSKIGSMISRVFKLEDREDNNVPSALNPSVPIRRTATRGPR